MHATCFHCPDLVPISIFVILAVLCSMQNLNSPTRDRTCTHCSGSVESLPLDHQGNPPIIIFASFHCFLDG